MTATLSELNEIQRQMVAICIEANSPSHQIALIKQYFDTLRQREQTQRVMSECVK